MPKYDFNKVAEIPLQHGCFSANLLHIFRTPLSKNTSGGLLLREDPFLVKVVSWIQVNSKLIQEKTTTFIFSLYVVLTLRVNDQLNAYVRVKGCTAQYSCITVLICYNFVAIFFFEID